MRGEAGFLKHLQVALAAFLVAVAVAACNGEPDAARPSGARTPGEYSDWGGLQARLVRSRDDADGAVVVLLHGLGANGDSLLPLARKLAAELPVQVVVPEAPVEREWGGRAWWDLNVAMTPEQLATSTVDLSATLDFIPPGLPPARKEVLRLLDEVQRRLRVRPGQIVLGGYSQGAILAMDVALHAEAPLAGAAAMSGTFLAVPVWRAQLPSHRQTPVFLSHGRQDLLMPYDKAVRLRDFLRDAGFEVTWFPFDGVHENPPAVSDELVRFVDGALARSRSTHLQ